MRKSATVQIVVKAKVFAMSHKKKKENENIGENSCEDMSEDEGSNPDIYKGNEVS